MRSPGHYVVLTIRTYAPRGFCAFLSYKHSPEVTFPRLAGKFCDHQEPSLFLSCCYTPSWSNTAAHAPSIMSAFQLEGKKKRMLKCISPFKNKNKNKTSKKFQPPLLPMCRTSAKRPYLATSHIGKYSLDPGSEKLGLWCKVRGMNRY